MSGQASVTHALETPAGLQNGPAFGHQHWARVPLSHGQKAGLTLVYLFVFGLLAIDPAGLVAGAVAVAALLYNLHLIFRTTLWVAGLPSFHEFALQRSDEELPVYSVIVPLYREANMMSGVVAALSRLEYPRDRLDVLLAIECDDEQTLAALVQADLPFWMRTVLVPPGSPRTKPRACNYALGFAVGSFVVVYDAEDRPDPHQLRDAIAAFDGHGPSVSCLQARLVPYNASESIISRMFALDYCQWFDSTLPGLQRLGMPLPLGGTSNHFRTADLVASGAWDSWNVTEDADLGLRLARLGRGVRTIQSTTFEEAPVTLREWLPQRARWIKGYLQTFLVHVRLPSSIELPPLNFGGLLCLIFFVGASVIFALVNPIFWGIFLYGLAVDAALLEWAFEGAVGPMAAVSMLAGNATGMLISALSPLKRGWWWLAPWAIWMPIYWLLLSIAAYWALCSFCVNPFYWAKTTHGVTRTVAGDLG